MAALVEMDTIKDRMTQTCTALQEADNWTTLSTGSLLLTHYYLVVDGTAC